MCSRKIERLSRQEQLGTAQITSQKHPWRAEYWFAEKGTAIPPALPTFAARLRFFVGISCGTPSANVCRRFDRVLRFLRLGADDFHPT